MTDTTAPPAARIDRTTRAYAESVSSSLKWDAARNEPYLQLPSFPNLRCTPFRDGIEDDLVELFNIHIIGKRLYVLPYPMHRPFAEDWVKREKPAHAALCDAIVAALPPSPTPPGDGDALAPGGHRPTRGHGVEGFPFQALTDTTTGRVVGEIGLHPHLEPDLYRDYAETAPTEAQFLALPPGERVWMVGYVLHPAYHGRGVMSEMLDCTVAYVRAFMEAGYLSAYVEYNNAASTATIRKARFQWVRDQVTPWPAEKGGGTHYSGMYVRELAVKVDVGSWGVGRVSPPDCWEQVMDEHKQKALRLEEAARKEEEEEGAAGGDKSG